MWTVAPFYEITLLHNYCITTVIQGVRKGIMGFREHMCRTFEKSESRNFERVTQMVSTVS